MPGIGIGLSPALSIGGASLIAPGSEIRQGAGGYIYVDSVSTAEATDPLDYAVADGLTVRCYVHAELGISEAGGAGTGVDTWTDQSSGGNNVVQATLNKRPFFQESDSTLDGHSIVYSNGSTRYAAVGAYNPPAPGTTPIFVWAVAKPISWISAGCLVAGNGTDLRLQQSGTAGAPTMVIRNNTSAGTAVLTTGQWYNIEGLFRSGTNSYYRVGATEQTGLDCGNDNPTAMSLFANSTGGSGFGEYALHALLVCEGIPSSTLKSQLRTWTQNFITAGIVSV